MTPILPHDHSVDRWLAEERLTRAIIGTFFCVYVEIKSTYELHKAAARQLRSHLRATNLEVGLLFHFGPEAKFYRLYAPNDKKVRQQTRDIGH